MKAHDREICLKFAQGGGFGGKGERSSMVAVPCALAAKK